MEGQESRHVIRERKDAAELLLEIIRPLKPFYSKGHAYLHAGHSGVHYGSRTAGMEGFARILWGLGPLWSQDSPSLPKELRQEAEEWLSLYRDGIVHGTDPDHEEYWGDLGDYDQKMVEMAALVTAVSLAREKLWDPLSREEKHRLYRWLYQINERQVNNNNWRFFRILVNMTFQLLGLEWSKECMKADYQLIDSCYMGDGWYYDGNPGQVDYYIPFAMHYYGLIYARFMEEKDPQRSETLKGRSEAFSRDYIYWFSKDGTEVPFGRSLTYRFAHAAFFPAMAFAKAEGIETGVLKYLTVNNLERWLERPIFDHAGMLTIGYGYPNLFMSERYNGCGSPYWGLKIFFMLALPDDHVFWRGRMCEPEFAEKKTFPHAHMVITHGDGNHVQMFPAGQHCRHNHGCCQEKYEKFVYSNQFGFSVSRGWGLADGAFDNTLAVSLKGADRYQMKNGTDSFTVTDDEITSEYDPMPGVHVKTVVIPGGSWHVRIHTICTDQAIDIVDGGFSIEAEGPDGRKYEKEQVFEEGNQAAAGFSWGISGAVGLSGGSGKIIDTFPNTNLLFPLAVVPVILQTLEPGTHRIVNCFTASRQKSIGQWKEEVRDIEKGYPCDHSHGGSAAL